VSGFTADWLDLRESADARARSNDIANALSARFALRETLNVVDLGCGTGANLRATAPLLPERQTWTLIDHDPGLLDAARKRLAAWADEVVEVSAGLRIRKGRTDISITFRRADLTRELATVLAAPVDLITASALFDLTSEQFIRDFARAVAAQRAAFLGFLTYNGIQRWQPHRPQDNQVIAAFNRHQLSDKGFGAAAGPMAAELLADQFRLNEYIVLEGDSPWRLRRSEQALIDALAAGTAQAALEAGGIDKALVERWRATPHTGAEIGHTDVFATPA
jgi:SAM-dependent methyltransferase